MAVSAVHSQITPPLLPAAALAPEPPAPFLGSITLPGGRGHLSTASGQPLEPKPPAPARPEKLVGRAGPFPWGGQSAELGRGGPSEKGHGCAAGPEAAGGSHSCLGVSRNQEGRKEGSARKELGPVLGVSRPKSRVLITSVPMAAQ